MYKLCTFITFLLLSLNIKAQETGFKILKTNDFKIAYPENWKAAKDGNVYNFFLKEELGDISISVYKNSNLTSSEIKNAILSINENKKETDTVTVVKKTGIEVYTYEFLNNGIKWMAKGLKKNKDFYFITLDWKIDEWSKYSNSFIKSFDSFEIK